MGAIHQRRQLLFYLILSTSVFFILTPIVFSAEMPIGLESGPYKVGFTTIEKYDYSRTYGEKYDYFGEPVTGETARPIQICIWYPAADTAVGMNMVYAEYLFPYPEDQRFFDFLGSVQGRELRFLQALFGGDMSLVMNLNNTETTAIRSAPFREGRYPLVVYDPDLGRGLGENAAMLEYLASHGFIVAAVHSVGPRTVEVNIDQADLETLIRDKEFMLSALHDHPHVDYDKIGAFGAGFGAFTSLILGIRNTNVGAVAGLDGAFLFGNLFEFVQAQPFFDPEAMKKPCLQLCRSGNKEYDRALVDSMKYCDRYLCEFSGPDRVAFSQYDLIARGIDTTRAEPAPGAPDYGAACEYIRDFFDGYLNDSPESLARLARLPEEAGFSPGLLSVGFTEGAETPPNRDQFLQIIQERGVSQAVELNEKFNLFTPDNPILMENMINGLGYQFMGRRQIGDAIEMFRMYTQGYPYSANAWDSFAEAHLNAGDNESAIKYYRKALEVLETDSTTPEQFKERIRTGATAALERLEQ